LDFHNLSKTVSKLNLDDLTNIEGMDDIALKQRFDALLFEFKGPHSRQTYSAAVAGVVRDAVRYIYSTESTADLTFSSYPDGLCSASDTYKYLGHDAPYIDLVAAIYWKDKLSQVENDATEQQLVTFYEKMYFCFYGVPPNYNGFWNYVPTSSRTDTFVVALKQYIEKRFPKTV
jgi:hypothetical protein